MVKMVSAPMPVRSQKDSLSKETPSFVFICLETHVLSGFMINGYVSFFSTKVGRNKKVFQFIKDSIVCTS